MSSVPITRFFNSVSILNSKQTSDVSDLIVDGSLSASGLTYPTSVGTDGQVLTTDGSGNLTFQNPTGTLNAIETNSVTGLTNDLTLAGKTVSDEVVFGTNLKLGSGVNTVYDSNTNELLKLTSVASAVNNLEIQNSATGNSIKLVAEGGDTNISVDLTPKGTGAVNIIGATDDIELRPTTGDVEIATTGGSMNIDINLTPKGTGAVICTNARCAFNNRSVSAHTGTSLQSIGSSNGAPVNFPNEDSGFNVDTIHVTTPGSNSLFTNSSGRTVFWMVYFSVRFDTNASTAAGDFRACWIRKNGSNNTRWSLVGDRIESSVIVDICGSALVRMADGDDLEIFAYQITNAGGGPALNIGSSNLCCSNRCQIYEFSAT